MVPNLKFYPPVYMEGPFRFGEYELVSRIGEGGMGQVFKAFRLKKMDGRELRMRTPLALKVPSSQLLNSGPATAAQMLAEAEAAARVHHPNVVSLRDVGEVHGIPFLVMDFLDGQGLDEELEAGPVAPDQILETAIAIAQGLSAIHQAGLVHRDLKPSNVFVSTDGKIKLLDLGIAKALDAQTHLTATGMSKGTPGYMAPEQLVEGVQLDAKSDLFSFGALIAELALGESVFRAASVGQFVMLMNRAEEHLAAESIGSRVNLAVPGLGDLVVRCMRKDPRQRPVSAEEIARLLRALGKPEPEPEPELEPEPTVDEAAAPEPEPEAVTGSEPAPKADLETMRQKWDRSPKIKREDFVRPRTGVQHRVFDWLSNWHYWFARRNSAGVVALSYTALAMCMILGMVYSALYLFIFITELFS